MEASRQSGSVSGSAPSRSHVAELGPAGSHGVPGARGGRAGARAPGEGAGRAAAGRPWRSKQDQRTALQLLRTPAFGRP